MFLVFECLKEQEDQADRYWSDEIAILAHCHIALV